jgi:dipeptidyl aminopeptidase/acylaminoacyl peptidase
MADSAGVTLAPDWILFVEQGSLVARRLDAARGELTGEPVTLARSLGADPATLIGFSASTNGILAYRAIRSLRAQSTWYDAGGNVLELAALMNGPDLSPDERYIAYDTTEGSNRDIWILDRERGGTTRLTTDPAVEGYPVWSPDGQRLVFDSQRNGTFDLWITPANRAGAEQLLHGTPSDEIPVDWSADGGYRLYRSSDAEYTASDLWALPMSGESREPIAVADSAFAERMGAFSPDGRWVAFDTDRSGRFEIIVRAFPEANEEFPVSTDGGLAPQWSVDGREIYFVSLDGTMMAAQVRTSSAEGGPASTDVPTSTAFEADTPVPLFATRIVPQSFNHQYTVTRDRRFLVRNRPADDTSAPITVVLNWRQ